VGHRVVFRSAGCQSVTFVFNDSSRSVFLGSPK
jgi:hypothetical protein